MGKDPKVPSAPASPVSAVVGNPWNSLRRFTPARIGLGRAGISLPTSAQLDFQLAHAQARDAVHRPLDVQALRADIEALGLTTVALHSAATSRAMYLQRPDLGRQLGAASRAQLEALQVQRHAQGQGREVRLMSHDIGFAVVDGLSALAVQRHAAPLIAAVLATELASTWTQAPVAIVEQGRVAVGDEIGALLGSRIVVVLIGERPGLSSPDSLGALPHLGAAARSQRCRAQLHFQRATGRLGLRRRSGQVGLPVGAGLEPPTHRRRAEG